MGAKPPRFLRRVGFHTARNIQIQSRAAGRLVFSGQAFRPAFAKGERDTVPRRACELKSKCRESKETIPSLRSRPGVPRHARFSRDGVEAFAQRSEATEIESLMASAK